MTKEEILTKINLLKDFCAQNGISEEELFELPTQMKIIKAGSPYDIFYDDGEVSCRIDLTKNPIAFRIASKYRPSHLKERDVWVAALVLKEVNFEQAQNYLKSLPKISSHPWRIPNGQEMTLLLEENIKDLSKLRYVFSLPYFMEANADDEQGLLGCFDAHQKLSGALYYYPGVLVRGINVDEKLNWWPMCDAD